MKVFVTGVTGFIGKSLITTMASQCCSVVAAVRSEFSYVPLNIEKLVVGDLSLKADLSQALNTVDIVIHCAARAHIINDSVTDPLAEFRRVNTEATLALAKQATTAGVKRFVFVSSIGVNGNYNTSPFLETDKVNPQEPYAVSKVEAELGLLALAEKTSMEVVIVRPTLVYGPNAPGNFGSLVKWVNKGVPLPLGAIHNQRSLVALDNLVSFIIHCIDHPKAANEIFLISDGEDVSTTELLQKVAKALDKKSILLSVPVYWMEFLAKLIGKGDVANRLFSSLQVDSSKARELLGWKPVITMDEQLKKTAHAFLNDEAS